MFVISYLRVHLQVHGRGRPSAVLHEAPNFRRPQKFARLPLFEAIHVVSAHPLVSDQHLSQSQDNFHEIKSPVFLLRLDAINPDDPFLHHAPKV